MSMGAAMGMQLTRLQAATVEGSPNLADGTVRALGALSEGLGDRHVVSIADAELRDADADQSAGLVARDGASWWSDARGCGASGGG